ncbi:hypothetical protein RvY_12509 [Ramazzottius varieornatus]|uniref:PRA1 family protein n=1 Tax=Ramazzottius varieornatus TaxID=947166 RepID=A0A1D1VQ71_RAMVA|nr:hypothetical protein RvY_12509 [Ramazzottius varieornatus]
MDTMSPSAPGLNELSTPFSTSIDLSGDMEIPSSAGSKNPSMASSPSMDIPLAAAASPFLSSLLARKLWSGFSTVKELPLIKETTSTGRQNMRSWFEFFNMKKFKKPTVGKLLSRDYYSGRVLRNVQYFHINYVCIFLVLFIYCILTSPLLLIALFASCGAFYYAHMKNSVRKIAIAGHEVTLFHQYCVIGVFSLMLFYYTGAGNAFMWVLGASLFFVLLHASLFGIEDDGSEYAFQLEQV